MPSHILHVLQQRGSVEIFSGPPAVKTRPPLKRFAALLGVKHNSRDDKLLNNWSCTTSKSWKALTIILLSSQSVGKGRVMEDSGKHALFKCLCRVQLASNQHEWLFAINIKVYQFKLNRQ